MPPTITVYALYVDIFPYHTKFYVGSTKNKKIRTHRHYEKYLLEPRQDLYVWLKQFDWDDVKMKVLYEEPYTDDIRKFQLEQYYIDLYEPELNMVDAFLTEEERIRKRQEGRRRWYLNGGKEYGMEWVKRNKDKVKEYQERYNTNNIEKRRQSWRDYRNARAEEKNIAAQEWQKRNSERYKCDSCGIKTSNAYNFRRHLESERHRLNVGTQPVGQNLS
jgi:hypothetical protein